MSGASASILTLTGVIGAGFIGRIVDKNKRFSETLKVSYIFTALGVMVFAFVSVRLFVCSCF